MNLRHPHDRTAIFDALLALVALFGVACMWLGWWLGGSGWILVILAFCGELILAWSIWIEPRWLRVTNYRVPLVHDPRVWIRAVFLSDFHAGGFHQKSYFERVVEEAKACMPDVVFLGGDYVVDLFEPIHDLDCLKKLEAPLGKFYVLGNHDLVDGTSEIRRALEHWGCRDLTNTSVMMEKGDRRLEVSGLDDCWYGKPVRFKRASLAIPHITLSHEPDVLMDLKETQTDLVLIGHTHGGQVRLPGIGPLWVPSILGRKADRGEKWMHGIRAIISHGLGETDSRSRFFSRPEIVCLELGL